MCKPTIAILTALLLAAPAAAQSDLAPSAAELGTTLRSLIVPCLPNPLVEQEFDWGKQKRVAVGVEWKKEGILLKPEVLKKLHNDGHWRKIAIAADRPDQTLNLEVKNVETPEPKR